MVTMSISPASLTARFIALFIDFCTIVLYTLCLFGATLVFYQFTFGGIPDVLGTLGTNGAHLLGFATLTFPVGLYLFLAETSRHHATLGKRIAKIKVVSKDKKTLSKKQVIVRTIVKLLPWEFAHTFVYQIVYYSNSNTEVPLWVMFGLLLANIIPFIYLFLVLFRKDHSGPHDLIAQTFVTTRG
jgi:uncharacterized RDD family membrane protein YckC